jgi:hypothetical protein
MQYLQPGSTPFWMLGEVVQFPIYFMDDFWLRSRKNETELPAVERLLQGEGLKVFGFHPVHIYLNTPSIEYYNRHKTDYQEPAALRDDRSEQPGTRDLFVSLLKSLSEGDIKVKTLGELYDSFTAAHPYDEIKL